MAAARNGVTKLVIVNGHGGNAPTLNFAAQMINRDAHIFVCVDSGESSDDEISRTVSVHPAIIIESLRKIYGAAKLADELERK